MRPLYSCPLFFSGLGQKETGVLTKEEKEYKIIKVDYKTEEIE